MAVFIAAILDGVDGRVARLTNTQSEFGVQYDSLADLISFGLAPALVMYHWALLSMKLDGVTPARSAGSPRSCMPPAPRCGWRGSTRQVGQVDKRWFIGLASPAAAGLVASFVWFCHDLGYRGEQLRYGALAVTVVAALLMVSRLRYFSFKGGGPRNDRVPFLAIIVVLAALVGIAIYPPGVLLAITAAYALSGPVYWGYRRAAPACRRRWHEHAVEPAAARMAAGDGPRRAGAGRCRGRAARRRRPATSPAVDARAAARDRAEPTARCCAPLLRAAGRREPASSRRWLPDPASLRGNAAAKRALWPRLRALRRSRATHERARRPTPGCCRSRRRCGRCARTTSTRCMAIEVRAYPFPWTLGIFRDCLRADYPAWVLLSGRAS